MDVLVDNGLTRFSVAAVASRAGVSTGALFYNYPSRAALIAAMTRHLFSQLEEEFVLDSTKGLTDPAERAVALVDAVWSAYNDPRMKAALELYGASRTDPELASLIAEIDDERAGRHLSLAEQLIGVPIEDKDHLAGVVVVTMMTIQGIVLDQLTGGHSSAHERALPLLRELVRGLVESAC